MPIIASAMQHSYDGDPSVAHNVENQMVADWIKAQAAGEVVAALASREQSYSPSSFAA